jgi:hypothetical protein
VRYKIKQCRFGKLLYRAFDICFNIYVAAIIGEVMGSQSLPEGK